MAMILPEKIDEAMNEWPTFWTAGYNSRMSIELSELLKNLKTIWGLVAKECYSEEAQEIHFKALWLLGYELSRDRIMSKLMSSVPVQYRIKSMIEDQGPLLFGYYTTAESEQFEMCCENLEKLLRSSGLWDEFSQN